MSLVAYEYSDSENENSETEDITEPENNIGKVEIPKVPGIIEGSETGINILS